MSFSAGHTNIGPVSDIFTPRLKTTTLCTLMISYKFTWKVKMHRSHLAVEHLISRDDVQLHAEKVVPTERGRG